MRLYHVIPKTGAPAEGPLTAAQVVALFERSASTAQMLVWWKDQQGWDKIGDHIAKIRAEAQEALPATSPAASPAPAPEPTPATPEISAGQVRVIRNGLTIGEYPEADIAALLRAKVILPDDSYLSRGMPSPAPVSELLLKMVLAPAPGPVAPIPPMPVSVPVPALPVTVAAPIRRQPGPGDIVCPNANCGYVGPGKKIARGSTIIGILLLLCWILPGVIYFMFFSGYRTCCPRCQCQINNDN